MRRRQATFGVLRGPRWVAGLALLLVASWTYVRPGSDHPAADLSGGVGALLPASLRPSQEFPATLEGGIGWINTSGRIHIQDLRGKVVLLDFWTYCCINCHHILPDLDFLEKKYPNELVVIGVHSGKFDAEKNTDNIRKKVAEYRIKHPVINDANQKLWNYYGVNSWPTLVLINARGEVVGALSGEGHRDQLDRAIGQLVREHKANGELNTQPLRFFPESEKPHDGPLLYPGKVAADVEGKRLFIGDTGHNRIVVTDLDGQHLQTFGTGAEGFKDGPADQAQFNRPQGVLLHEGKLYVADTENHAIRELDLDAKTVRTVAGTGEQSYRRVGGGPAAETGLSSPWDLAPMPGGSALAIAMAGTHQIRKLDQKAGTVGVWAGTGQEDIQDAPVALAAFAQPSGLATDGKFLYVADSEGSAVRAINFERGPRVVTIAGTHDLPAGQSLFAFGDRDGRGSSSRLQHCLGVAYADNRLYVADTYNNKIKVIDLRSRDVDTLAGSRSPGSTDDPAQFDEPGGVAVVGDKLYVADTNNHAIRTVERSPRGKTTTLTLKGVEPPSPAPSRPRFPNPLIVKSEPVQVAPGARFTLAVTLLLPEGWETNTLAPMPVLLEAPEDSGALGPEAPEAGLRIEPPRAQFEVEVPLARVPSPGESMALKLSVASVECKKGSEGLCRLRNFVWEIPVTFADGGTQRVELTTADAKPAPRAPERPTPRPRGR
jgi:DNA-binding beta-propeller fold protein YncE